MAALKKTNPLNTAHTSGIFSDLTVDGPEIGTLVMVVDRAKNLPNRKTIGKQDPYCAARLGKHAKKTKTDIRGGQRPLWDQELRFTVHDCPDYLQLKVSVFNDDKKTDLIGETWIDLREIVVPGGGQSDSWHSLNFRSKYAGEIRLEITYYDTRPKPDKPVVKAKPSLAEVTESPVPPPQPTSMPKRRPLPSEPPNGPPAPAPAPPQDPPPEPTVQTPPRPQPSTPSSYIPKQSPLQAVEYNTPSPSARYQQRSQHQSPAGTPGGGFDIPPPQQPRLLRGSPERPEKFPAHLDDPDFGPDDRSQYSSSYSQPSSSQAYERPPRPSLEGPRDPRRPSMDEDRPPPPPVHRSRGSSGAAMDLTYRNGNLDIAPKASTPNMRQEVLRSEAHRQSISSSSYPGRPTYRAYDSAPDQGAVTLYQKDELHLPSPPRHHSYDPAYDAHHKSMQPTVEDDPDSPGPLMTNSFRRTSGVPPQLPPQPPPQQQPSQPQFREPDFTPGSAAAPAPLNVAPLNVGGHRASISGQYGQAPVATPPHHGRHQSNNSYGQSVSPGYSRDTFVVSPEPMASDDMYQTSPGAVSQRDYQQTSPAPGPSSQRDYYQTSPGPSSSYSAYNYNTPPHRQIEYRNELEDTHIQEPQSYGMPSVPASLVPGVDPGLALELSSRMNDERRQQDRRYNPAMTTPTRGRQMIDYPLGSSPQQYSTPPQHPPHQHQRSFDRGPVEYANGPSPHGGRVARRSLSPNPNGFSTQPQPQHTIRRKSVSPAPPPQQQDEPGRRLSGVPFGPDSYDELNPSVAAAVASQSKINRSDYNEKTGKIISHDGREIDPSDHLPMETWAPEPEPRKPTKPPPAPSASASPLTAGGLPIGPSGRRQLRVRPQSMSPVTYSSGNVAAAASSPSLVRYGDPSPGASPSAAPGRNRLQKKTNRVSSGGRGESPLAPLTQPHHLDNHTPPRAIVRANTFDYQQNENHAPLVLYNGGRSGGGGGGGGGGAGYNAPPIPAKVPFNGGGGGPSPYQGGGGLSTSPGSYGGQVMSGALTAHGSAGGWGPSGGGSGGGYGGYGGGGMDGNGSGGLDPLMEEMRRIDIGTGRARRHGGGY